MKKKKPSLKQRIRQSSLHHAKKRQASTRWSKWHIKNNLPSSSG